MSRRPRRNHNSGFQAKGGALEFDRRQPKGMDAACISQALELALNAEGI